MTESKFNGEYTLAQFTSTEIKVEPKKVPAFVSPLILLFITTPYPLEGDLTI